MPNLDLSEKISKAVFCPFWQLNCSNFGLGRCRGPCPNFRVWWRAAVGGGVWALFFESFLLVLAGLSFWRGGLGAGLSYYGNKAFS